MEKNGVREKSFLKVLVFGHPYCSGINSTQFNSEHENTCSIPCHIDSPILTFWDMYLHVIVWKKMLCNFLYKIHHIYKKIKHQTLKIKIKSKSKWNQIFKKNSYKNLFFILFLYYILTEKLHGNALSKEEKLQYFSK